MDITYFAMAIHGAVVYSLLYGFGYQLRAQFRVEAKRELPQILPGKLESMVVGYPFLNA